MKPGTVFRWDNFPFPRYGHEIKPRWFIYLGETGLLSNPIVAYLFTTTSNLDAFKPGGSRSTHIHLLLKKTNYKFFDGDCILDIDGGFYDNLEKKILESNPLIEIKGELDYECLKTIYKNILKSRHYSRKIILDIHTSLNRIGITGLVKP